MVLIKGPLVGDNFVRYLRGGALGITNFIWNSDRKSESGQILRSESGQNQRSESGQILRSESGRISSTDSWKLFWGCATCAASIIYYYEESCKHCPPVFTCIFIKRSFSSFFCAARASIIVIVLMVAWTRAYTSMVLGCLVIELYGAVIYGLTHYPEAGWGDSGHCNLAF